MAGQSIRPSQFITTYGPGSILEGPDGPRIIFSLQRSGLFTAGRPAADFDITDSRLSEALLDGAGVLRLPTNAELGVPDSAWVYDTGSFPSWSLCEQHHILYRSRPRTTRGCPDCPAGPEWSIWTKSRREAIRFVRACPNGHLDDVDWPRIITHRPPQNRPPCNPSHLQWAGPGGALRNIEVRCPECRESANLGLAYGRNWPCSARLPESGQAPADHCDQHATMMQRGAANLRVPELISVITIPPRDTALHRILDRREIRAGLAASPPATKGDLVAMLQRLAAQRLISPTDPVEVDRYAEADVMQAVRDIMASGGPSSAESIREEEFEQLQRAGTHGAPAVRARTPGMPPLFEVIQENVRSFAGPAGTSLRITPVSRLQVTMVQLGYRRLVIDDPFNCAMVPVSYYDGQRHWFPGVELFGEGVFVDLAPVRSDSYPDHFSLTGSEADAWRRAWADPAAYGRPSSQSDRLHPVFVWWHTLGHRLITALAVDSGYSSAAVRERVYARIDPRTGTGRGGVLLYTAQPGGDGTLGGLISLATGFDRVLWQAFNGLDACSNDPLCGEETFGPDCYNGAACYACLLVSETSCEFRNTSLDRNLLLTNLP